MMQAPLVWIAVCMFGGMMALVYIACQLTWWLATISEYLRDIRDARRSSHWGASWKEALHEARLETLRCWLYHRVPPMKASEWGQEIGPNGYPVPPPPGEVPEELPKDPPEQPKRAPLMTAVTKDPFKE